MARCGAALLLIVAAMATMIVPMGSSPVAAVKNQPRREQVFQPRETSQLPEKKPILEEVVPSPADGVAWATRDLAELQVKAGNIAQQHGIAVKDDAFYYYRWLWIGMLPAKERVDAWKLGSLHTNFLSRESDRTKLYVLNHRTNWTMFRIDLRDYGIDPQVWDQMGTFDPVFFYPSVKQLVEFAPAEVVKEVTREVKKELEKNQRLIRVISHTKRSKTYKVLVAEKVEKKVSKRVQMAGTWLVNRAVEQGPQPNEKTVPSYAALQTATHSAAPIVSLPWFFYQTATAEGRDDEHPGYYQFNGIKDQKTFENLIAYRNNRKRGFIELRAAIKDSGVARQPRRIERDGLIPYWRSFDNELAVDRIVQVKNKNGKTKEVQERRNPLRTLDDSFVSDASEIFGMPPNRLWKVAAWSNKQGEEGTLQTFAPGFVGHNKITRSNNGRIGVGWTCFACHKNGGLQDLTCNIRTSIETKGSLEDLGLFSPLYHDLKLVRQQYTRPLDPDLAADRLLYQNALWELTEWRSEYAAQKYHDAWHYWTEIPVTRAMAARWLGVPTRIFVERLKAYTRAIGGTDLVLMTYLSPNSEERTLPWDQFYEILPLAHFIMQGEVPLDFAYPHGHKPNSKALKTLKYPKKYKKAG